MSMNDPGVDKVAARLTIDISPAQQQLNQLASDYVRFNQQISSGSGQSALEQAEAQKLSNIRNMDKDSAAQRLMMFAAFTQSMDNAQKEFDTRQEQQQQLHLQKMESQQQMYEERILNLQKQRLRSSASSSSSNPIGNMVANIGQHALDIAAGMTFYQLLDEMAKLPQAAIAAEQSMTKLKQVLELTPSPADIQRYGSLNGMLSELQQVAGVMAQTYGVDLNVVIDAMSQIGRKYKDVGDIVVATDTALQMFAVDNVPVATSVQSLEAMMSQFGLNMQQARQALFQLTAAAHSFQVTGTDLMTAIERSGASFNTLHMNTAQSIAAISTLAQITAQSGSVIGNSWKSIEASIVSDKGIKALQQLGIEAHTADGQLKDGVTILQDLQSVWPKLTDAAKVHFAEVLAGGKFQYERLLSFLNDYSGQYERALTQIQQATQQQQEALVASALESPQKQFDMTRASAEVLATTIMQQLNPALIQFMTEVRMGTGYINDHWQSIEHWINTGAKLGEAYIAWKVGLAAYNAVLNSAIVTQLRFATGIAATIGSSQGFVAGLQSMGGAVMGFSATMLSAIGRMGAFLAIFQIVSTQAARAMDPLQTKVNDIQSQIFTVNDAIQKLQSGSGGFGAAWSTYKNSMYDVMHGDFVRAGKDLQSVSDSIDGGLQKLEQERSKLQSDLQKAQDQQNKAQADEIQKSLDQMNKIIAEQMKNAQNAATATQTVGGATDALSQSMQTAATNATLLNQAQQELANQHRLSTATLNSLTQAYPDFANAVGEGETAMENFISAAQQQEQATVDSQKAMTEAVISGVRSRLQALQAEIQAMQAAALQEATMASNLDANGNISVRGAKIQTFFQAASQLTQLPDALNQALSDLNNINIADYQVHNSGYTGSGPKTGSGGSASSAASAYAAPFQNLSTDDSNALQAYVDKVNNTSASMQALNTQLSDADNNLKSNIGSQSDLNAVVSTYNQYISATKANQAALTAENNKAHALLNTVNADIAKVNEQFKSGQISAQAHKDALNALDSEWSKLTNTIKSNEQAINSDNKAMDSATKTITSEITATLKQAYTDQQQIEDQRLSNIYQPEIDALTAQKDAVDQLIQSLNDQYAIQDAQTKLAQDQQNLNTEMTQNRSYRVVNADGSISWTYDTTKVEQMQDQVLKDQRDVQKAELQQQSNNLADQLKAVQDTYNQQKTALDDYWKYKLSTDNLNTETDNAIAKDGLIGALKDVTTYTSQIIGQWNAVQQAKVLALGSSTLAGSLGGTGFSASGSSTAQLNSYWQKVQAAGGAYANPAGNGMTLQQQVAHEAALYGIPTSDVQVKNGQTFVPWQYVQNHAIAASAPSWSNPAAGMTVGGNSTTTSNSKVVQMTVQNVNVNDQSDMNYFLDQLNSALG